MNTAALAAATAVALGIRAALKRSRAEDAVTDRELANALIALTDARLLLGSDPAAASAILHRIPAAAWPIIRDAVAEHPDSAISVLAEWLEPWFLDEPGIPLADARRALFIAEVRIRRHLQGESR